MSWQLGEADIDAAAVDDNEGPSAPARSRQSLDTYNDGGARLFGIGGGLMWTELIAARASLGDESQRVRLEQHRRQLVIDDLQAEEAYLDEEISVLRDEVNFGNLECNEAVSALRASERERWEVHDLMEHGLAAELAESLLQLTKEHARANSREVCRSSTLSSVHADTMDVVGVPPGHALQPHSLQGLRREIGGVETKVEESGVLLSEAVLQCQQLRKNAAFDAANLARAEEQAEEQEICRQADLEQKLINEENAHAQLRREARDEQYAAQRFSEEESLCEVQLSASLQEQRSHVEMLRCQLSQIEEEVQKRTHFRSEEFAARCARQVSQRDAHNWQLQRRIAEACRGAKESEANAARIREEVEQLKTELASEEDRCEKARADVVAIKSKVIGRRRCQEEERLETWHHQNALVDELRRAVRARGAAAFTATERALRADVVALRRQVAQQARQLEKEMESFVQPAAAAAVAAADRFAQRSFLPPPHEAGLSALSFAGRPPLPQRSPPSAETGMLTAPSLARSAATTPSPFGASSSSAPSPSLLRPDQAGAAASVAAFAASAAAYPPVQKVPWSQVPSVASTVPSGASFAPASPLFAACGGPRSEGMSGSSAVTMTAPAPVFASMGKAPPSERAIGPLLDRRLVAGSLPDYDRQRQSRRQTELEVLLQQHQEILNELHIKRNALDGRLWLLHQQQQGRLSLDVVEQEAAIEGSIQDVDSEMHEIEAHRESAEAEIAGFLVSGRAASQETSSTAPEIVHGAVKAMYEIDSSARGMIHTLPRLATAAGPCWPLQACEQFRHQRLGVSDPSGIASVVAIPAAVSAAAPSGRVDPVAASGTTVGDMLQSGYPQELDRGVVSGGFVGYTDVGNATRACGGCRGGEHVAGDGGSVDGFRNNFAHRDYVSAGSTAVSASTTGCGGGYVGVHRGGFGTGPAMDARDACGGGRAGAYTATAPAWIHGQVNATALDHGPLYGHHGETDVLAGEALTSTGLS
eukprot:TRINITY_DN62654_c0_g1_i1.p1 TRINITY_DN62654_c0_g1~~TRINITY_DN62654_c0_g1_i1.p1  ORF type:complete len:989 (-),score=203.35 TRINITY_DN62654_c0_g1_i1:85-3051(-)